MLNTTENKKRLDIYQQINKDWIILNLNNREKFIKDLEDVLGIKSDLIDSKGNINPDIVSRQAVDVLNNNNLSTDVTESVLSTTQLIKDVIEKNDRNTLFLHNTIKEKIFSELDSLFKVNSETSEFDVFTFYEEEFDKIIDSNESLSTSIADYNVNHGIHKYAHNAKYNAELFEKCYNGLISEVYEYCKSNIDEESEIILKKWVRWNYDSIRYIFTIKKSS